MDETITIYRAGSQVHTAPVTKDCTRKYELMKEDKVTLSFATAYNEAKTFEIGDYVVVDGEKFVLNEQTAPTYNQTTGGYEYRLDLLAEYWTWSNTLMKSVKLTADGAMTFGETEWNLTATLEQHACAILRCAYLQEGRTMSEDQLLKLVRIDTGYIENASEYKHVEYKAVDLISAIEELCKPERYNCEWWFTRENGQYILHFGRMAKAEGSSFVITQGENGIITREPSQRKFANRIFVYGGTQNVPYSYRKQVWLTNEREDGKLWDSEREITFDMIDAEKKLIPFEIPNLNVAKAQDYGYKGGSTSTARIGYSARKTFANIPRGKYKLHLSQIAARFSVFLKEPQNISFEKCRLWVTFGYKTNYESVLESTEYVDAQGGTIGLAGLSVMEDEDVEIVLHEKTWLMIDFEVILLFPYDRYSSTKPIKQYEQALKDSDFSIFQTSDNQILERLDYEDAPIKVRDKSGNEYDAFLRSTIDGDEIFSTTANFSHGDQYTIEPLIYGAIGENYYTPDDGEDVINGLTEMRLRLPQEARTTPEGYINRNGYIETADAAEKRIVEASITHDDIFPQIVSMPVTAVDDSETREATTTYSDGTASTKEYKVFRIYAKMTNGKEGDERQEYDFKEEYLLNDVGNKLKVKFSTGQLAGMEFEAIFDEESQSYLIVPNRDYGAQLPSERLHPSIDDEIILIGWDARQIAALGLIDTAEQRLLEEARKDLKEATEGVFTYRVNMMPDTSDFAAELTDASGETLTDASGETLCSQDIDLEPLFAAGSAVTLHDEALFAGGESNPLRIIGYETKLDIPWDSPKYTIGEIPKPSRTSRINKLETRINELAN